MKKEWPGPRAPQRKRSDMRTVVQAAPMDSRERPLARALRSALVVGRRAFRERPSRFELQHQRAVVLAHRGQLLLREVEIGARRTPIGTAALPLAEHVMGRTLDRRRGWRVEVRDLLRPRGIADVEHPNAGVEISA